MIKAITIGTCFQVQGKPVAYEVRNTMCDLVWVPTLEPHFDFTGRAKVQDGDAIYTGKLVESEERMIQRRDTLHCQLKIGFIYNYCATCRCDEHDMDKCPRRKGE
jgi:hypothetical protein